MSTTVDNVQSAIAAILDQDQDTDNIATTDYSLRLEHINQRERKWAEVGKWDALYTEYNTLASTPSTNVVPLPAGFRELAAEPKITYDGSNTASFSEIRGQEKVQFNPASDKYVEISGNPNTGYDMLVNPATSTGFMASGASIFIPYFSTPTSPASPTNVITCPNPDYIIQGVIADIWQAREDSRFPQAQADANVILQNMLEFEFTPSEAAFNRNVKTVEETRHAFRLGRN